MARKKNKKNKKSENKLNDKNKPENNKPKKVTNYASHNEEENLNFNFVETLNKDINIQQYSMSTPDGATPLLIDVSIKLNYGYRYGLVGKNGYGKTTLLENMANYKIDQFPKNIKMLYVRQEDIQDDKRIVFDAVLESDNVRTQIINELNDLERKMDILTSEDEIESTQMKIDNITKYMKDLNIHESHSKVYKILTGLGFSKKVQKEQVRFLSGGWKMRFKLAEALFVSPDLLLLDEPTNHLDFPAVLWLQNYLTKEFNKTLVVVSHDKLFLNSVITNVIHLDHLTKKLDYYKGNYTAFEISRKEKIKSIQNTYRSYEIQLKSIKEFVEKFKDKGEKRAAQVQSKLKILKKLEETQPEKIIKEKSFKFNFPVPEKINQLVASLNDVSFGYVSDNIILKNVNLSIDMDSRIGVIGANGVGKSTLIKLLIKNLEPTSGISEKNNQVRFAFFSQHHYEQLNLNQNAIDFFLEKFNNDIKNIDDHVQFIRKHLGRFGIKGDRQNQTMKYLSGGQKTRVVLAIITFKVPHFIIMDEPTNHLDLETIDSLINALNDYEGGVLVISHDTHFLKNVANVFWSVTENGIVRFTEFELAKENALKKRICEVNQA